MRGWPGGGRGERKRGLVRRGGNNATRTQYIFRRVFFKRLGLLILKMSVGSRWLVAHMWEVGPSQEHSECSFPKILSPDHTAARSDSDKAGPEDGCSPHSESKGSAGHFSLCIRNHFSRLQLIRFPKRLGKMIFIPFHSKPIFFFFFFLVLGWEEESVGSLSYFLSTKCPDTGGQGSLACCMQSMG